MKETLVLDKPAYVGMCILDLSKRLMYEFHHNYVKHRYGKNAKLLFADADSLCYETEGIYRELWEDRNLFDNSDYPKESQFFDLTNMKVYILNDGISSYAYGQCQIKKLTKLVATRPSQERPPIFPSLRVH